MGCIGYGYSLASPFFDPAEIVRMANASGRHDFRQRARQLCTAAEQRFGEHYKAIGLLVEEMMRELK